MIPGPNVPNSLVYVQGESGCPADLLQPQLHFSPSKVFSKSMDEFLLMILAFLCSLAL